MACGYAIASPIDRQLAPFLVPKGMAESDIAARLFTNWVELHGLFSRASRDAALRVQLCINHNRHMRELQQGETVFRKLPHGARMQKHLFPAPSCGPYVVERQPTHTSVVLRDPKTGELVDRGAYIPLEQILIAPLRTPVEFSKEPDVRSFSEMVEGKTGSGASGTKQGKPGKRAGWDKLGVGAFVAYQSIPSGPHKRELSIGKLLIK